MLSFNISSLFKFLIGILLLQGVTVLLVVTAFKTSLDKTGLLFVLLALSIGFLTALWFNSIADGARKQALARAREGFSRQREKIRVRAEKEKIKEVKNTQRQVNREKRRGKHSSNLKTGVAIGGAVGVGVVMMLAQFVTLGLLTLTTAGGAALGYGVRARQERFGLDKKRLLAGEKPVKGIEAQPIGDTPKLPDLAPDKIRDS